MECPRTLSEGILRASFEAPGGSHPELRSPHFTTPPAVAQLDHPNDWPGLLQMTSGYSKNQNRAQAHEGVLITEHSKHKRMCLGLAVWPEAGGDCPSWGHFQTKTHWLRSLTIPASQGSGFTGLRALSTGRVSDSDSSNARMESEAGGPRSPLMGGSHSDVFHQ